MAFTATAPSYSVNAYIDDAAQVWNIRGNAAWAADAASGATVAGAHPFWGGRNTKRRHPRYVIYQDPASGRTVRRIVYTPAAMAALAVGATHTFSYPGLETAVAENLVLKEPERQPTRITVRAQPEPTAVT
jgi:hypothetical protein